MVRALVALLLIAVMLLGDATEGEARSRKRSRTGRRAPEPQLSSPPTRKEVVALCRQARGVALIDADTHQPLLLYRAEDRMPPASTVKLLLLLAVAERLELGSATPSDTCAVSALAASMTGQRLRLRKNERYALDDLALATAVYSANDAAMALAEGVFGSRDDALEVMNDRAADLGMTHSSFYTPNGLPQAGRPVDQSCAWDLAVLGAEAVRHPRVMRWCSNKVVAFPKGKRLLHTSNRLLGRAEGVDGLKTGYTRGAGFCFVGTAERDGRRLVCVVLGSRSSWRRWQLAEALFNYGFGRFESKELLAEGASLGERPIGNAPSGTAVNVVTGRALRLWIERDQPRSTAVRLALPDTLQAPLASGQRVGEVRVYVDQELAARVPACVPEGVRTGPWYRLLSQF
jgi:D-alanyl-D-alanine carboxypeptidase (penicillin-binding protein 5/6)